MIEEIEGHSASAGSGAETKAASCRIGFVGDVLFGELLENYRRGVRTKMEREGIDPFQHCREEFARNDLTIANLECVISEVSDRKGIFREILRAPASAVKVLVDAGIGAVSLANNHAVDHGRNALLECVDVLKSNGIAVVGFDHGRLRQTEPVVLQVKGVDLVLWSFNLANLTPQEFSSRSREILGRIRGSTSSGRVVVLMHWGEEYTSVPPQQICRLGKEMAAEGTSIVCGHHSHRLQGVSMIGKSVFAPSLGNFIFDDRRKESTLSSMLRVRLKAADVPDWECVPFAINNDFQPMPDESLRAKLDQLHNFLRKQIVETEVGDDSLERGIQAAVAKGHKNNQFRMRALMLLNFYRYRGGYGDILKHLFGIERRKFSVSDSGEWV